MSTSLHSKIAAVIAGAWLLSAPAAHAEDSRNILWQGLLGAGTGALSAELSGGKAGTGALVGAGTNIIGGALLSTLMGPSGGSGYGYSQPVAYSQPRSYYGTPVQPAPAAQPVYTEPVYYQPAPSYTWAPAPYEDPNKKIIKQGLLGAGVGAIAAETSGGKAGTGALVGAGTNIIGGALLDTLMAPSPSAYPVSYSAPRPYYQPAPAAQPVRRIVRKYDGSGNLISEEEFLD